MNAKEIKTVQEIQNILDRNFTRGNNAKALNELLIIFQTKNKEEAEILPNDSETEEWFDENVDKNCSASSAIYKFRLWLADRLAAFGKEER